MSEETFTYEGYTITTQPRLAEDSDIWAAVITISRDCGGERESWLVSAGAVYDSREESVRCCRDFAKEIIDREMKGHDGD